MYPKQFQNAMLTSLDVNGQELEHRVRVDHVSEETIIVTAPIDANGYAILLPVGASVRVGYLLEAYVSFETDVLGHQQGRVPLVVLRTPEKGQIRREQRRQNFRVPVTLSTVVRRDDNEFRLNLLDLSAGGYLATSSQKLMDEGDEFDGTLVLDLEKGEYVIEYRGMVARVEADISSGGWTYGVEFHEAFPDSERIVRYCMERQRRFLRTSSEEAMMSEG